MGSLFIPEKNPSIRQSIVLHTVYVTVCIITFMPMSWVFLKQFIGNILYMLYANTDLSIFKAVYKQYCINSNF